MAKINKEMIARILQHVGGAGNVAQAGNCMTRLRLTLRDESRADSAAIRQIDGVMGVIVSDEQFQVVLGPGKAQSAAEMMNALLEDAPAGAIAGRRRRRKETGAEEQANQRHSKIPREIRYYFHPAHSRFYRRRPAAGVRHFGGADIRP